MTIQDNVPPLQEVGNLPQHDDIVLGGNNPLATAAVLGGQDRDLAKLFNWFNSKTKHCGGEYTRLFISQNVAVIGRLRPSLWSDLIVKVLQQHYETHEGELHLRNTWEFGGYIKHNGILFLPATARYDPADCKKELRAIAYADLLKVAKSLPIK